MFRYRLMKKEGVDVPSFLKAENLVYVPVRESLRKIVLFMHFDMI